MNAAIVDTDVVSILFKGDSRAQRYRVHVSGRLLGICFMTLAELERWSLERGWGLMRRAELAQHLTRYVVLPASRDLCARWAQVSCEARRKGHPIQTADAWVAASALHYEVPLITNNPSMRSPYSENAGSEPRAFCPIPSPPIGRPGASTQGSPSRSSSNSRTSLRPSRQRRHLQTPRNGCGRTVTKSKLRRRAIRQRTRCG
jgi:tRNA(fMet)-specific endonuclease VapC